MFNGQSPAIELVKAGANVMVHCVTVFMMFSDDRYWSMNKAEKDCGMCQVYGGGT